LQTRISALKPPSFPLFFSFLFLQQQAHSDTTTTPTTTISNNVLLTAEDHLRRTISPKGCQVQEVPAIVPRAFARLRAKREDDDLHQDDELTSLFSKQAEPGYCQNNSVPPSWGRV
jgi:hypothetical protein